MKYLPLIAILCGFTMSPVIAAGSVEKDKQSASKSAIAADSENSDGAEKGDAGTGGAGIDDAQLAGHSKHGEEFNEGPRQQAYLMAGTGEIKFETSSKVPLVQKFIEQGIGQLHGFWYFEAERSFRQAAMLDPDCAIAYWGMAAANENNKERAKQFIERAFELIDNASPREEMYILAMHEFITSDKKKKKREAEYITAIEKIIDEFPKDVEAKALLGFALYKYRSSSERTHAEVDVVLDEVLAKSKNHPVHHYRIHLWDHKSPQRALDSAAKCGPAAEGIAHMWHMCGHIFSRVKRYGDAAWFQEASARVDHRHMMHDRVLPDQIHNFAHNNEWLIRNLMNVGRVRDAMDLAKNMIELPRHPKYNSLDKRNSATYGRDRLMNVLERFELWDEAIELSKGPYLEPTDVDDKQLKRLRLLGEAYAKTDKLADAHEIVSELEERLDELKEQAPTEEEVREELEAKELEDAEADESSEEDDEEYGADGKDDDEAEKGENADSKGKKKSKQSPEKRFAKKLKKEFEKKTKAHESKVERIERDIACVTGYVALARGETREALSLLEKAEEDELSLARVRLLLGEDEQTEKAVKDATKYAKDRKRQVQALAGLVEICWNANKNKEALDAFVRLRANSNWLELDSPVFDRLEPIANELGYSGDWRIRLPDADDLGKQPELAELGPFRWQPAPAPDWLLPDADGRLHSMREYRGRPVIMVFYLGYGCLHCAEQLQAIAPMVEKFDEAGISLIAVSSDDLDGLDKSQENYEGTKIPFPLVANPSQDVFKAFRAYDDFEDLPLHGTYLIDGEGKVRWQDISYDPFMDIEFLLSESKRLLGQDRQTAKPAEDFAKTAP